MKKSERYHYAMIAVLKYGFSDEAKIEILETLMEDRGVAVFNEKQKEKDQEVQA